MKHLRDGLTWLAANLFFAVLDLIIDPERSGP
jgi:hypothetical protein